MLRGTKYISLLYILIITINLFTIKSTAHSFCLIFKVRAHFFEIVNNINVPRSCVIFHYCNTREFQTYKTISETVKILML